MAEIDRELLQDIGFEKGTGWDVEVWVFGGWFWVYFEDSPRRHQLPKSSILITDCTRQEFFEKFFEEFRFVLHEEYQDARD